MRPSPGTGPAALPHTAPQPLTCTQHLHSSTVEMRPSPELGKQAVSRDKEMTNGSGKGRTYPAVSNDSDGTPGAARVGETLSVLCPFNIKGSRGPCLVVLRNVDISTRYLPTQQHSAFISAQRKPLHVKRKKKVKTQKRPISFTSWKSHLGSLGAPRIPPWYQILGSHSRFVFCLPQCLLPPACHMPPGAQHFAHSRNCRNIWLISATRTHGSPTHTFIKKQNRTACRSSP